MSRGKLIIKSNLSTLYAGGIDLNKMLSHIDIIKQCQETEQHNARGHDGSFQAPGGLTHNLESGLKRLRIAGQVLQTVMAETMQVVITIMIMMMIFMIDYEADEDGDIALCY